MTNPAILSAFSGTSEREASRRAPALPEPVAAMARRVEISAAPRELTAPIPAGALNGAAPVVAVLRRVGEAPMPAAAAAPTAIADSILSPSPNSAPSIASPYLINSSSTASATAPIPQSPPSQQLSQPPGFSPPPPVPERAPVSTTRPAESAPQQLASQGLNTTTTPIDTQFFASMIALTPAQEFVHILEQFLNMITANFPSLKQDQETSSNTPFFTQLTPSKTSEHQELLKKELISTTTSPFAQNKPSPEINPSNSGNLTFPTQPAVPSSSTATPGTPSRKTEIPLMSASGTTEPGNQTTSEIATPQTPPLSAQQPSPTAAQQLSGTLIATVPQQAAANTAALSPSMTSLPGTVPPQIGVSQLLNNPVPFIASTQIDDRKGVSRRRIRTEKGDLEEEEDEDSDQEDEEDSK